MMPLRPLRFIMVADGKIPTALILDRVFSELAQEGVWDYSVWYYADTSLDEIADAVRTADVAAFLRSSRPEELELFEAAKQRGIPTIYVLDDDFNALDPTTPLGQFYAQPEIVAAREAFLREADLVWVFTEEMRARYAPSSRRVLIGRLPSFVEDQNWSLADLERTQGGGRTLTVGYTGGLTHQTDLEAIIGPLLQVLDSREMDVHAEFVGCIPPALQGHPKVRFRAVIQSLSEYYQYMREARWSVGLSPLRDTIFNRGKTNNKYREYAALGIPGIYSDMPVYSSTVRHRETGYIAPHTEEGMYQAMTEMLSEPDLRRTVRRNALRDAATTYAQLPLQQQWLREVSLLASRRDEKVRLLVVGHEGASTTHVDALPACRALGSQKRVEYSYLQPSEVSRAEVAQAHAVFLVRAFQPEVLSLLDWVREANIPLVCSYDDDFFSHPPDSALGEYLRHPAVQQAMRRFLQECSLVACSTPPLAERSREFNENAMEAIYGFDTGSLPVAPLEPQGERSDGPVRIGFFGLQWPVAPPCVTEALRRAKRRLGRSVQFELITGLDMPAEAEGVFDWRSTEGRDWSGSLNLLRERAWDIGLAPLEDTVFTRSKQATKFRDYAWAGLAMICSRVPTYERVVIDGIHGLLVANTTEEWEAAIIRLVEDGDLRESLRRGARDLFSQAYTLDATICSWYQLLWRIARHREDQHASQRESAATARSCASTAMPQMRMAASTESDGVLQASRPLAGSRLYSLTPESSGWQALDVMLGLHQRPASGQLVLSIYPGQAQGQPLRVITGDLRAARDNAWFTFLFPPIMNSAGRRMTLHFELAQPGPGALVSLYERGPSGRSLAARARRRFFKRGGILCCRLGYQS